MKAAIGGMRDEIRGLNKRIDKFIVRGDHRGILAKTAICQTWFLSNAVRQALNLILPRCGMPPCRNFSAILALYEPSARRAIGATIV
jgi:hypothetical protein